MHMNRLLLLMLLPFNVFAVESEKALAGSSFGAVGGNVLVVLLLIVGLLFALTWLLKRSGIIQNSAQGHLKIIGGLSVGPRERIVLLQVGQEQILVGVTAAEISLLHMLTEPVVIAENQPLSHVSQGFAERLQALMNKRKQES
jgi:flagellar protein FliO/FliZ